MVGLSNLVSFKFLAHIRQCLVNYIVPRLEFITLRITQPQKTFKFIRISLLNKLTMINYIIGSSELIKTILPQIIIFLKNGVVT